MNENLTKAIRILDPVDSIWRFRCRGITQYIVKCHIRSIHDIDTPERGLFNEEILHRHVADVPENERHRPSWLCVFCFSRIANIIVAVDTAGSVTINMNAVIGKYEASVMVLEGSRIRVVAPV